MKIISFSKLLHIAFAAVLAGSVVSASAAEPDDIIKYRQNVMKSNGANAAAAAAIIQGKVDAKNRLADHAKALEMMTKNIPALFPKGSDFGAETKALDAVWKKPAEFEKAAKNAEQKAAAFSKAVAANDPKVGLKFKELAETCKTCHKDFRKDDKKQ